MTFYSFKHWKEEEYQKYAKQTEEAKKNYEIKGRIENDTTQGNLHTTVNYNITLQCKSILLCFKQVCKGSVNQNTKQNWYGK